MCSPCSLGLQAWVTDSGVGGYLQEPAELTRQLGPEQSKGRVEGVWLGNLALSLTRSLSLFLSHTLSSPALIVSHILSLFLSHSLPLSPLSHSVSLLREFWRTQGEKTEMEAQQGSGLWLDESGYLGVGRQGATGSLWRQDPWLGLLAVCADIGDSRPAIHGSPALPLTQTVWEPP